MKFKVNKVRLAPLVWRDLLEFLAKVAPKGNPAPPVLPGLPDLPGHLCPRDRPVAVAPSVPQDHSVLKLRPLHRSSSDTPLSLRGE